MEYRKLCIREAERIAFYHKLGCVPAVEPDQKLIGKENCGADAEIVVFERQETV